MWSREKVRNVGREAFKRNYWKCVLFNIFLSLVAGQAGSSFANGPGGYDYDDFGGYDYDLPFGYVKNPLYIAGFIVGVLLGALIIVAVASLIQIFVINPIEIGARRFYFKNLREPAKMKEIAWGYDTNYKNVVKTLFLRDLYTFLWSLLFIIPGIIKFYEYAMIPYLLSENPDMTPEQAFSESKRMMDGEKGNAFLLDLSFIGWFILSILTFGLVWIFYAGPYWHSTRAALYDALCITKNGQYNNFNNNGFSNFSVQEDIKREEDEIKEDIKDAVNEVEKEDFGMTAPEFNDTNDAAGE